MAYRRKVVEKDFSGFVIVTNTTIGAMVLDLPMGPKTPVYIQNETQFFNYYGIPQRDKWGALEALQYLGAGPLWIVAPYRNDAKFAGLDVGAKVVSFGARSGRDLEAYQGGSANYNAIPYTAPELTLGIGNGSTSVFAGTVTGLPATGVSVQATTLQLLRNGYVVTGVADLAGNITGPGITSGTINYTTGAISITFSGVPGTVASLITDVDCTPGVNLSTTGKEYGAYITIDGVKKFVNFGNAASTTRTNIIDAINNAFGTTVAITSGSDFISLSGTIRDAILGYVRVESPTDLLTFSDAVPAIFQSGNTTGRVEVFAISPTGGIPKYQESIAASVVTTQNLSQVVGFSFFTRSPYNDSFKQLAAKISNVGGRKYRMLLYDKLGTNQYRYITQYDFSLDKEVNNFGASIYIMDVFRNNPYVVPYVNPAYTGPAAPIPSNTDEIVEFSGGNRGSALQTVDYQYGWDFFKKIATFPAKLLMDVYAKSASATAIRNIIKDYQKYSFGLTAVPFGLEVPEAIAYRKALNIDFDGMALYYGWVKIKDTYNDAETWTTGIGKVGRKLAEMIDVYDALSPAGTDESGLGGQLNSGFQITAVERELSDADPGLGSDLEMLDQNQINPIINDLAYGPLIYGDKTLQIELSDTSYIGTRRVYNVIIENILRQVLRRQEFKNNDFRHRAQAQSRTEDIVSQIKADQYIRDVAVQCDEFNNDQDVLNARQFVLDVAIQATPNSQGNTLNFIRVSQNQIVANVLKAK